MLLAFVTAVTVACNSGVFSGMQVVRFRTYTNWLKKKKEVSRYVTLMFIQLSHKCGNVSVGFLKESARTLVLKLCLLPVRGSGLQTAPSICLLGIKAKLS